MLKNNFFRFFLKTTVFLQVIFSLGGGFPGGEVLSADRISKGPVLQLSTLEDEKIFLQKKDTKIILKELINFAKKLYNSDSQSLSFPLEKGQEHLMSPQLFSSIVLFPGKVEKLLLEDQTKQYNEKTGDNVPKPQEARESLSLSPPVPVTPVEKQLAKDFDPVGYMEALQKAPPSFADTSNLCNIINGDLFEEFPAYSEHHFQRVYWQKSPQNGQRLVLIADLMHPGGRSFVGWKIILLDVSIARDKFLQYLLSPEGEKGAISHEKIACLDQETGALNSSAHYTFSSGPLLVVQFPENGFGIILSNESEWTVWHWNGGEKKLHKIATISFLDEKNWKTQLRGALPQIANFEDAIVKIMGKDQGGTFMPIAHAVKETRAFISKGILRPWANIFFGANPGIAGEDGKYRLKSTLEDILKKHPRCAPCVQFLEKYNTLPNSVMDAYIAHLQEVHRVRYSLDALKRWANTSRNNKKLYNVLMRTMEKGKKELQSWYQTRYEYNGKKSKMLVKKFFDTVFFRALPFSSDVHFFNTMEKMCQRALKVKKS